MRLGIQIFFQPTQTGCIDVINFPWANIRYDAGITEHRVYHMEYVYGCVVLWFLMDISYTLGREYRVMRNRYSRLLFTSEDRICANLRVQEQSTNMTSQC